MLRNALIFMFIALLLVACAKTGTLSGGEKDETPPAHVESKPPLESVNTNPKRIDITFDEFIQLKSVHQELIVSPPLNHRPQIELRNKTIRMELFDTLQENTTYTFNFGNAIADFREGNVLPNFLYVFSTGPYLDSMAVTGRVVNAFNLQPLPKEEKIKILLYKNLSDTAFLTQRPLYVGQADEHGYFSVPYMQTGEYAIYALTDNNRSYKYDAAGEKIAFLDSTFYLHPESFPTIDTATIDSITQMAADTVPADSLTGDTLQPAYDLEYALHVTMRIFEEDRERQVLAQAKRAERNYFQLIFKKPHPEDINVRLLNLEPETNWFLEDRNPTSDTITYWITDSTLYNRDSLITELQYYEQQKNDTFALVTDTVRFMHLERKTVRKDSRKEAEAEPKPSLALNVGGKARIRDINKDLSVISPTPIGTFQQDSITLRYREDTLWFEQPFTLQKADGYLNRLILSSEWKPGFSYDLTLLPEAVTNIYNLSNDTIVYKFSVRKADYYGQLNLTINGIEGPTIIQMLHAKNEKVYREYFLNESTTLNLQYLHPNEYKFKAIYDTNENGKWDTGDLKAKRQPEKVEYLQETINVRSNWEIEHSWELENDNH